MSLLYKGNYYNRFKPVLKHVSGKKVTELCFGDIVIADYCSKNQVLWEGLDLNQSFVKNAVKKGFNAHEIDIEKITSFPKADTCIICGSLYHFHTNLEDLFSKMLKCSSRLVISEPIINLSNNTGIIGKLAKASASVNGKIQDFRFTEKTLLSALNDLSTKMNFQYSVVERFDKDIIILIQK